MGAQHRPGRPDRRGLGHCCSPYGWTKWATAIPDQNHANVYGNPPLRQVGIHLPPINTTDYAYDAEILDSAYTVPMFELAISQFTETFYPEILGMTLQLEWEVLALWPTVKLLRNFDIDSHFYELHIGIDNAANGHGAKARDAVNRFLDEAYRAWRRRGSAVGMAAHLDRLRRVRHNRHTGQDLRDLLEQRRPTPTRRRTRSTRSCCEEDVRQPEPRRRSVDGQLINDLFEDPEAFMAALVESAATSCRAIRSRALSSR